MANDFPGPLSPEQLAAVQGYYGVPGVNMSAPPAPAPAGPVDAGAYYNYAPPPDEPLFGPPAAPPAPARPVGAQLSQTGDPHNGPIPLTGKPAAALAFPDGPAPNPEPFGPPAPDQRITAVVNTGGGAPSDDREFAAHKHLLATKKSAPSGGGSANPDPYGVKGAQKKFLGTFDEERDALKAGATAEGDRAGAMAGMRQDLARQQQEDAAIHAHEQELAQSGFDAHMGEVQRQLDAVREQKIDPGRLMHGDGMGALAVIGGLFGGLYMGLNKLDHNPFLDDLNKQIDRDIAVQEKNIDGARRDVSDRMNLLREQRATFKDNELAKLQSRQLMYEATKQSIEAKAADYDQPIVQARAQQAISGIDRAQSQVDMQIKEAAMRSAQAQAAAGAAQLRAQQLEMRKAFGDTYEKNIAAGMAPAQAESEAGRMVQNLFQGGAAPRPAQGEGAKPDPVSMVPKDQRSQATKEMEEHAKAESGVKAIDKAFASFKATGATSPRQLASLKATISGAYKAGLGPGMSSDKDFAEFIEPNIPLVTDSDETLAMKHRNIAESMRSKVATPTLDQHAPGWKGPAPVQLYDTNGKPKS